MNSEERMLLIAKSLKEINSKGKVKAITANERGYARILDINAGLSLIVYHTRNYRLTINLIATEAAIRRYPDNYNKSVKTFLEFHHQNFKGLKTPQEEEWINQLNRKDTRSIFSIDVTTLDINECIKKIDTIKLAFLNRAWSKPNKL
jgi:hypothetical protein